MGATGSTHETSQPESEDGGRSPARTGLLLFVLAFGLRLAFLLAWSFTHPDFYRLSGETGKVALSLIASGAFADPYAIPTGPTAHPAPLWPALLAVIYGVCRMTAAAGYARALVAIATWSLLCALEPWFGRKLGLGARAGTWAGVAAALWPQPWYEMLGIGWSAAGGLALGLVTVGFVRRWKPESNSAAGSWWFGMGCGAAFHVLPTLLPVVLACLAFELGWKRSKRAWLPAALVAAGALLACVPWTWRNHTALGGFCFIRSNLGLELRIANQDGADADIEVTLARKRTLRHPSENRAEALRVRELGEAEYMRQARNEALAWIAAHPLEFLRLTAMRFLHFWCGSPRQPWRAALTTSLALLALFGLRRAIRTLAPPSRAALLIPLLAFPPVYYIVSYVEHYPAPLTAMLLLLASYAIDGRYPAFRAQPM